MKTIRLLKCMLLATLMLAGFGANAQDVGLQWAKGLANQAGMISSVHGVDTDANKNVYVTGYFTGTVDFNPGPGVTNLTSNGDYDTYISKFDQFGSFIWAKRIGSTGNDRGHGLIVDPAGNFYISGNFTGTVDFNPGAATNNLISNGGSADAYILKLNSNGDYLWAQRMGGPTTEYSFNLAFDPSGNVIVGGYIGAGVATFPGVASLISAGGNDGFVAKLTPAGVFTWAKRIGSAGTDYSWGLDTDAAGNVYVSGVVAGPSTGMATFSGIGGYVLKLNSSGTTVWSTLVPESTQPFRDLKLDNDGNVFAGGQTGTGSVNFVKLNSSGVRQWAKRVGDGVGYLTVSSDNKIYLAGNYTGTKSFGSSMFTAIGDSDAFVARITADGDFIWAKTFGGPGADHTYWMSADHPGELLVGGYYSNVADFDPGPCVFNLSNTASTEIAGQFFKLTEKLLPDGFAVAPSTLSPMTQSACILGIPSVVTGSAVGITSPAGSTNTIGYQWQKSTSSTGPWEDMPGEVFKDLQPLASSETLYYRRMIRAETNFCGVFQTVDSSAVATVNVGTATAPTANADGPQWFVCGAGTNTVALAGSATGGSGSFTYQWYQGSSNGGSVVASTASYTTAPVTQATTYTLKVTDAAGCIDTDQVTIVPAIANAGPNASFCQGSGGLQIGTSPVASPSVKYAWTRVSGDPISSLSCTTCAQPVANPATVTVYRLTVTTTKKDGTTCTTFDDVTVTPVTAPGGLTAFAGTDKTICINSNVQLGSITDATYTYTWSPGQFLDNTAIARPTFTAGSSGIDPCAVNYTVTAVKNGCSFVDEVKVSVLNSETSDTDDIECGPRWVTHEGFPNCAEAVYSWSVVSGNGTVLSTRNGGEDGYLKSNVGTTRFRRSVTLNGITCSSIVDITANCGVCDVEIETISSQGCPKVFPGEQLRLAPMYINTTDWNYQWSPANLVDNPTAREVSVLTSSPATLTLTITNKYDASITCSESIDLNPAGATQPTIVLNDKSICYNTPTAIGSPVSGGFAYTWTPSVGLDNASVNNPMATLTSDQEYIVEIEDTEFGCKTIDTVKVTVAQVVANAGVNRTICNGATVTLGTAAPAGTNWTYSWQPAAAAWTNGTNASMPQPQVEFSATGSQTFELTVTDPASGCTMKDTVTLSNELTPGEYTGSAVTICEGEEIQLGKDPVAGATYLWTGAGLSCTTCSNPVATPTTTTTYSLQISYPGCTAPMIDQVTVTVNEIPDLVLNDVIACASGPVAIGFGAATNSAAPAGASYLWSPATGLSSAVVANPTANVTTETTYSVVVTLANGCTFTDEVVVTPTGAAAGSDVAICAGEATQIGTPAIAGATYAWTGAGIVGAANVAQPTVRPTVTTTYSVSVTRNGCTRTDNVVVTVNTPVAFNITGNTAICVGGNTTLSLVGAPAANTTWQWSPTAGVASPTGTSTMVTTAQTQTYRLTQTNLNTGCSNFKEVIVTVKPNTITASTTPLAVCAGVTTPLPLTVTSTGSYQYVWSPATGLSSAFVANPTVTTSTDRTYNVVITDTQSQCQLALSVPVTVRPGTECLAPVALRGNVFHDANALKDVSVNSTTALPIPTGLYASLLDGSGAVLETVPVNADGSYDFGLTAAGTYNIALHQNPAGSATPNLPASWINTGENLGTGAGSDAGVNGLLTAVTVRNVDVTNANFGIQQPPLAEPKIYVIDQPQVDQIITLDGTHVSTGSGTSSPAQMTGTDPEDGVLTGDTKNRTVVITTLADRGELWYNGVLVKTGQVIPNYDPALMTIKLTGSGYTNITYLYAYVDQAGVQSPPVTYKISWGSPLPVTLISFDAKAVENTAVLNWATTAESNSDRFEVERSLNGKQWERIGTVRAQGESAATVRYNFTDLTPSGADNYYRLKMIDKDMSYTYSGIRSASFDLAFETSIFPNPATDKVNLKVTDWKKVAKVQISNLAGINVYRSGPLTSEVIDVKSLPEGTYILSITHVDGSVRSHKLVHLK